MKRKLWLVLKLTLTTLLLGLVLVRVPLGEFTAVLADLDRKALATAALLTAASVLVSTWRWWRVLRHLGESARVRDLFGDTLLGTTYNLILPTSVGGDVARAYRCGRRLENPEHAWASVFFERVMGLLSLALVSTVGLLATFRAALGEVLVAAVVLSLGLGCALAYAPAPLRLAARLARGRQQWQQKLERLAQAFAGPLARPAARLEIFGWSLLYQVVALSLLLPVGLSWNEPGAYGGIYLGIPIALIISTLPITIGGLGLREGLFVLVLAPFGFSADRALALGVVWLSSNVLVGLAGLGWLALERR